MLDMNSDLTIDREEFTYLISNSILVNKNITYLMHLMIILMMK